MNAKRPVEERLWRMVDVSGECWEWQGVRTSQGYGRLGDGAGHLVGAHRAAYESHYGPFDLALCVLHRCDNPPCCRPDHLFLGTNADNMRDMKEKGRARRLRGAANPTSKLTDAQVLEIRERYTYGTGAALAREFGVSQPLVSAIVRRKARV